MLIILMGIKFVVFSTFKFAKTTFEFVILLKNHVFSRVGDCYDPILDPTPDRNPFWIAIRKGRIAIKNFGSRSEMFGSRSAIGS